MALGDRAAGLLDLFGNAYDEFMNKDKPKPPMMGGLGPVTPEFAAANQGDMPILDEFGPQTRVPMLMEGQVPRTPTQRGIPIGSEVAPSPIQARAVMPSGGESPEVYASNMRAPSASDIDMRNLVSKAEDASRVVQQIQANPEIERQPGFMDAVKGYFGNRENMIRLAMGFNSMRLNPDAALTASLAAELKDVRATRRASTQANQTAARLRAQGTPEAIRAANMIDANPTYAKEIFAQYLKDQQRGGITYTKEQLGEVGSLRDDLRKDLETFTDVQDSWERISTLYTNPGAVGDYALAVAFAKILDPGSVAKEGEVAAVQRSGAITQSLKQSLLNAIDGKGSLPPEMRNEILNLSARFYGKQLDKANATIGRYEKTAQKSGISLEDILMINRPGDSANLPQAVKGTTAHPGNAWTPVDRWKLLTNKQQEMYLNMPEDKQRKFWEI